MIEKIITQPVQQITRVDDPAFLLAVSMAHDALVHAEIKHPDYHFSNLRKVAIIAEDAGEAVRAALLQLEDIERGGIYDSSEAANEEIAHEVAQCAAMCLRYLMGTTK